MNPSAPALRAPARDEGPAIADIDLGSIERDMIPLFVSLADALGLRRSVAEIYGFLFCSTEPVPLDRIVNGLGISAGSASQGLRALRGLGAVSRVYLPRDRRDHYVAELSLRRLVSGLLRERLGPRLETLRETLDRIEAAHPDHPVVTDRIGKLRTWHRKANSLLPLALRVLGE
jgi:DNA-binding transcriptional regulator GbsR (MarR family)